MIISQRAELLREIKGNQLLGLDLGLSITDAKTEVGCKTIDVRLERPMLLHECQIREPIAELIDPAV
jgi:hypothetical protein